MSALSAYRTRALLVLLAPLVAGTLAATTGCRQPAADEATAEDAQDGEAVPAELAPGLVRPEARFAVAPTVGERFPDVEIHDAEGRPVHIRELAGRKPYTVLTLGCLT